MTYHQIFRLIHSEPVLNDVSIELLVQAEWPRHKIIAVKQLFFCILAERIMILLLLGFKARRILGKYCPFET